MKIYFYFVLWIINNFLSGTHFFSIKRKLLNSIGVKVGEGTSIVGPIEFGTTINIEIGKNCWIGKDISFDGDGSVKIGDNVDIAPHCVFCTGGHLIGKANRRAGEGICSNINVENGCWIGTNVTIINNTSIGMGTVVGAGATVICNTEKNTLVVGCPAKTKRIFEE